VYLAGQVPSDSSKPVQDQTRQVLSKIEGLLKQAGSSKSRLLNAQVFLANIDDFEAMNEVWEQWIDPANPPARLTVQARLGEPDFKIEIAVIAALSEGLRLNETDTSF